MVPKNTEAHFAASAQWPQPLTNRPAALNSPVRTTSPNMGGIFGTARQNSLGVQNMRTFWDRARHALLFEIFGLILVLPLGALVFAMPMEDIGVVGVVSATLAMAWNYVYNLIFDTILRRSTGTTLKSVRMRVAHAVLFELGL